MEKYANLYHPDYEHDACGVGLLVDIHGYKSHDIVEKSLQVLENMLHRGAESADNQTGIGASLVVRAIVSGRDAAKVINEKLKDDN